jgi:Ribbon-helix-helix protein, copG family
MLFCKIVNLLGESISQLAVRKPDRVHIGAYVDRGQADELARLARERDRSVSSIIRRAWTAELQKGQGT